MTSWSERAWAAINAVDEQLPEDCSPEERKTAIDKAYPFGVRKHHPYKVWLKARKSYLAPYLEPKTLTPLEQAIATADDRIKCAVPFCNRTTARRETDGPQTEFVCGPHYRLADKELRRLARLSLTRANNELKALLEIEQRVAEGSTEDLRPQAQRVLRFFRRSNRFFQRIKKQSIERAAGI